MKLTALFDGGARPTNPGHGAYGVVLKDESGTVIQADKKYLGDDVTNNEAEWRGFLRALDLGLEHLQVDPHAYPQDPTHELVVMGDSKLVISQMTGAYNVESRRLAGFKKQADKAVSGRPDVRFSFVHIPSGHKAKDHAVANNREADALVDSILANIVKPGDPVGKRRLDGRRLIMDEVKAFFGDRVREKYPWLFGRAFTVRPVTFYCKIGYDNHLPSVERKVWEEICVENRKRPVLLVYRPYGNRPVPLSMRFHGRIDAGYRELANEKDGGMELLAAWADTVTCEEAPPPLRRSFDGDDPLELYLQQMPAQDSDTGETLPALTSKRYGFRGSAIMVLRGTWIPLRHLRGTLVYEAGREHDPTAEGTDGYRIGG